jgi:type I restriction enzyme S subunit
MRTDKLDGYRPYPEYKESGVEWLGKIPTHWSAYKTKQVASLHTGGTPAGVDETAFVFDGIPWIKPDDLLGTSGVSRPKRHLRLIEAKSIGIVPRNSVFVCGIGTVGKFGYAIEPSCTNQQINSITFGTNVDDRFAVFAISSLEQEFLANSNKVTISICNKTRMGQVVLPLPPLPEQQAIGRFLDHKTSEIDALIAAKERLIDLLQEKRAALITQAVTKGLDPSVPMKDSGVEWLGRIPAHWEFRRTKSFFD